MAGDVGKGAGDGHRENRELGTHPLVLLSPEQRSQVATAVDAALTHESLSPEQVLKQHMLDRLTEGFASSRRANAGDDNPVVPRAFRRSENQREEWKQHLMHTLTERFYSTAQMEQQPVPSSSPRHAARHSSSESSEIPAPHPSFEDARNASREKGEKGSQDASNAAHWDQADPSSPAHTAEIQRSGENHTSRVESITERREGKESKELQQFLERAQPRLSDEALEVIARLDTWVPPLENLPVDRVHFQLPEKFHPSVSVPEEWKRAGASARLDRIVQAPGAPSIAPSLDVMRLYEQRGDDMRRLWQLVDPPTYKKLTGFGLTLKPEGTLAFQFRLKDGTHLQQEMQEHLAWSYRFSRINGKAVLLIDVNLSPAEAIRRALLALHFLENLAQHVEAKGKEKLSYWDTWKVRFPHQRMVEVVELNRNLAEYGLPERYNPVETTYREAYDQAIKDAYARGQIDRHTPDDQLRALGQQAGRDAIAALIREGLSVDRYAANLPTEFRRAEKWGITPMKLGSPAFRSMIERWAQGILPGATQTQNWIWVYTQNHGLEVHPRSMRSGKILFTSTHTMVARGEPIEGAGGLPLEVTRTGEGEILVEARQLTNLTGHYQTDFQTLRELEGPIREELRSAGIRVDRLKAEDIPDNRKPN